ncbi:hypothetical protein THAOC_20059, partial [Thalassiosira oceanica]
MEGYNRRKASFPRTGAGQHSSPLCWPGRVSIVAKCAPEGVPSGHEEGEARQLKTNPLFPTQSYPQGSAKFNQFPGRPSIGHLSSPSVASARTSSRCWRSFSGERSTAENSICGVEPLLLARSLNWSSRAVCSCLVARAHHSQQASATYARSSAGPRIHYLDAPQTQPSSARLQRQQAGRGRLKPGVRQNRVTTALGARRFLGLPLRNATCLLASTPCSSAFNQLWRWGP